MVQEGPGVVRGGVPGDIPRGLGHTGEVCHGLLCHDQVGVATGRGLSSLLLLLFWEIYDIIMTSSLHDHIHVCYTSCGLGKGGGYDIIYDISTCVMTSSLHVDITPTTGRTSLNR